MKKNFFLNLWVPVLLWAGLIFYLSSLPNLKASPNPFWDDVFRSILHSLMYLVFALLCWRPLKNSQAKNKNLIAFLLVLAYSLFDEIHQSFVPTRTFQVKDLLVDNLGGLTALLLITKFLPRSPVLVKRWAQRAGLLD
jgi:VanZ family protein